MSGKLSSCVDGECGNTPLYHQRDHDSRADVVWNSPRDSGNARRIKASPPPVYMLTGCPVPESPPWPCAGMAIE